MSREEFAEIVRGDVQPVSPEPSMGFLQAAMEGIQAIAPGLTLDNIIQGIGSEMTDMVAHGAHELAAALNLGSAFVMYPRAGQDLEPQIDAPELDRGGREW